MPVLPDQPDPAGTAGRNPFGAMRAALDAIFKEDDRIGGRAVTRLTATLPADDVTGMLVESTIGFGEWVDNATIEGMSPPFLPGNARLLVNGEIITARTRRSRFPFQFEQLARAQSNTVAKLHPQGTLVYDLSHNVSAIDHLRRGFLVEYAIGEDLEIIARNLGLHRCPGMSQETLRRVIKAVAYLPKTTAHAFREALTALFDSSTVFSVIERTTSNPFVVFVEIAIALSTDIRGRFLLNGGEPALTTGANSVDTANAINHVIGVFLDTPLTRRGFREGFTNYLNPGGTFLGSTITLGTSPGAAGTAVIVDYGAFDAHYLAADETVVQDAGQGDHWAYLADPLFTARCLLDQIRAAGVQVRLSTRL
jgi:hypothetical protein